ncbi:MAG: hypothetical protein V2A74_15465, partial [bacterium]
KVAVENHFRFINTSGEEFENADIRLGYGNQWQRDLKNNEAIELVSFDNPVLPVKKLYIFEPAVRAEEVPLYYEIKNDELSGFGKFKLPAGKFRIFQQAPSGGSIFLGEDWLKELPVKEKDELRVGSARDVVVKRDVVSGENENVRRNNNQNIVLFDRVVNVRYEIENFKKEPVTLKIVEPMKDYWKIVELGGGQVRYEKKDNSTLEIFVELPPKGEKQEIHLIYKLINQTP